VVLRIKRDSVGFRAFTFTPRKPSSSMQGSDGRSLITLTGRALTRCLWFVTCQSPPRIGKAPCERFAADRPFANPDTAARNLVEAVQSGQFISGEFNEPYWPLK
jgi:hypothetical protein